MPPKNFTEILLGGLAPDGGLAMPDAYPKLTAEDLTAMRRETNAIYRHESAKALGEVLDDHRCFVFTHDGFISTAAFSSPSTADTKRSSMVAATV